MVPAPLHLGLFVLLAGCADGDGKPVPEVYDSGDTSHEDTDPEDTDTPIDTDTDPPPTDADADGYVTEAEGGGDCDDEDATIHPWAEETCEDGLDSDCDGIDGRCGAWPSGDMAYVAEVAFWGENPKDAAGHHVSLEDMNGDGLDDALILAGLHGR